MGTTAPELARRLGVDPKRLRAWLRDRKAEGHPLLVAHVHNDRWQFTEAEADQLALEFAGQARVLTARAPSLTSRTTGKPMSGALGHRVVEEWMGEQVQTLADLLRPGLRAVCVGINPAPVSVAAGHYYQGVTGKRFFSRLRTAGALPAVVDGFEDDAAFAAGVGFTDIVKRPTARARDVLAAEFAHGRQLLLPKLQRYAPGLVIFTFKKAATALLGPFAGNGLIPGMDVAGAEVFVMPGPYEASATAEATLRVLAGRLA